VIKEPQVIVHETDQPDFLGDLFDADVLSGEDMAEIDLTPLEADAATVADRDGAIVEGIFQVG
jgi:hypothetical protein